jgi:hypothetical protein
MGILGHKTSLKLKKKKKAPKTQITSCTLSNYNGIKLEISNKRNYRK